METRLTVPVFTVGGGPCGIMLATGLGRCVVSAVIDRRQRAADRALVEADDVADPRSRNVSRVLACRGELQIARLSVPAHGLPSLSAHFDMETSRTALEEQTAGGPQ